jgi:hypothetical protein
MIRLAAAALICLALQARAAHFSPANGARPAGQDPLDAESKFKALLDRVEKSGLAVPDLPEGAAELEKLLLPSLPKDLRDRHAVVRAQSAVLEALHAHLLKNKGGLVDFPIPPGKLVSVKIVDVLKRGVKISRPEGTQDFAYSEIEAEWALATARPGFAGRSDAALLGGLWLAKAARWDAAFLAFGDTATDHPLAAEARKRGLEASLPALESIVRGKRWTEALTRLETLDRLAPGDARLSAARGKLLDAMVEHGMDLCRKKSKGPMKDLIDLIAKHFPDGASRIEDIREAGRWIKITDPAKFKVPTAKGPPWLLAPKEGDTAFTGWLKESAEKYEGVACVVRVPKGEETMAGLVWDHGQHIISINGKNEGVGVYAGNKGELLPNVFFKRVALDARHHLSARLRGGSYVVQYNGVEIYRADGKDDGFEDLGLNAHLGKAWFDEVWLLKKE